MATVVVAGLSAAIGSAAAGLTIFGLAATSLAGFAAAFALGAGLSLVSRALMPKPDLGVQMAGQSVMTREAAHSRKIIYGRARIGGNVVYLESTGDDNKYLWLVTAIAGHEIDGYEEVWFNDKKIWDGGSYVGNWGSYVDIGFYKGDQTSADNASQRGTASLVSNSTKWTDNHKLLDTAYIVVKLTYDQEQFAQGLPNISTVVRGKKVWHPNHSSPVWSQNPALCIRDYLTDTKYGLGESSANIASINTAFGICNEAVDLAAGGTQPRYTLDGVIDTGNSIKANIENMVGAMIGRLVYSGGKFEIHAGEYVAPTVTIDESMMIGEISVQTKQSRRSAYNGVKGVFLSEEDNYILADYPAQISSTYAAQDGDPIYLDMPLPYTVNNVRAQRIAQLALRRSRQQESITIPCNLNALKFKIGDNISVTNERLGYSAKVFEVVGYSMGFSSDQMVVNVDAIETASSIWSWDEDEEVFLGAGEVDIYDGTSTTAPASITVTADTFISADGTSSASFKVTWPDSVDAFVDHYVVEWKVSTDSSYFSQATKVSPSTIIGLDPNKTYDVRVKAVNGLAVSSSYVSAQAVPAADTTAPSLPTSISATAGYKSISLAWTNPSEKDFSHVEIYRSTASNGTYADVSTGNTGFSAKVEHLDGGLADATTYYYKFRSVDYSGNKTVDGNGDPLYTAEVSATTNDEAVDGINTAPVYAYKRSSATLGSTDKPTTTRTWNFANASFNDNDLGNNWTGELPPNTDDLYICAAVASSIGATDSVVAADWSPPQVLGTKGEDGYNTAVVYGYKRSSATVTNKPSITRTWTFSIGTFDDNDLGNDFTAEIPTGTDDLYFCTAVAKSQSSTDSVTGTSDWSAPQLFSSNGAAGVRNASGYVYYSLSVTGNTGPTAPTASAYNFGTGAFSDLTDDWSRTPPVNTGGDAKYWATSYYVTEATYNGTQTITFGTVFNSVTFDGLVTFTNLNTALSSEGGNVTTIDGGLITTDSITVNKLSGDVTEVYPIAQYYYTALTSSEATLGSFTLPAPTSSILKRQKIDINVLFKIVNSAQTPTSQAAIVFTVEKKSKGVNGVSVGTVTVESESLSYNQLLSISGNVLDKVDISGGVAASVDASGTNEPAFIQAIYYDSGSNKTFIQCSALTDLFSTGNTMYFSDSKFNSAGTWVTPTTSESIFVTTPPDPVGGVGTSSIYLPFKMSYGQTTTLTDYRVRAQVSNAQSGVTYTAQRMLGTLENIS